MLPLIIKAAATATPDFVRSPWFSPAGKKQLAKQLVALIPDHHTYVEPFIGSGAVFFGKKRTPREVVNDLNPKLSQAFADLKGLTSSEIAARLAAAEWSSADTAVLALAQDEFNAPSVTEGSYAYQFSGSQDHFG